MREEVSSKGVDMTSVVAMTAVALAKSDMPPADGAASAGQHSHSSSHGAAHQEAHATSVHTDSLGRSSPSGESASAAASGLPSASHWGGGHSNQSQADPVSAAQVTSTSSPHGSDHLSTWSLAVPVSVQGWGLGSRSVVSSFAPAAAHAVPTLQDQGAGTSAKGASGQLPPSGRGAGQAHGLGENSVPPGSSPVRGSLMPSRRLASEAESELDDELMASLIPDLGIGLPTLRNSLTAAVTAAEFALVGIQPAKGVLNWSGSASSDSHTAEENGTHHFPMRAGHPVCDFYQKTGHCKVNIRCTGSPGSGYRTMLLYDLIAPSISHTITHCHKWRILRHLG